jgi:phospholipid/cholesterol/gamma-HCH transport system substrate-binding protein
MKRTRWRALAAVLAVVLALGVVVVVRHTEQQGRIEVTGYFANSNGLYVGDEVRVLGIPVGKIDRIEADPDRAKITFWVDDRHKIPADVAAAIISPSLVSVRAIQLTPAYAGGPVMGDGAVIPQQRTVVPVEWDDLRDQLERLTQTLQPTTPGGQSTLGQFVSTAADNLRGQGANIHNTLVKLSQAFSALGDHSQDIFTTVRNLSVLVSALQSSTDLMRQLNQNLAGVTSLLANDSTEVGVAVQAISDVIDDVHTFTTENTETVSTTSAKLASVTSALNESLDDIKQTLHITPTAFSNFLNIYQPAQGTLTGAIAINNFANPVSFLCGAIQAASRLGAEQSAKLCVQYLAPIIKNRQFNFPPIGENLFLGPSARPNELTYSEDWLRPEYVPPAGPVIPAAPGPAPLAAESAQTDPNAGLPGLMVPSGAGS